MDETNAIYKILADFSNLSFATRKAKQDIKDLQRAEKEFNKESVNNARKTKQASTERTSGYKNETRELGKATTALKGYKNALRDANQQQINLNRNVRTSTTLFTNYRESVRTARSDVSDLRKEHEGLNKAMTGAKGAGRDTNYTRMIREQTEAMHKLSEALGLNTKHAVDNERETGKAANTMRRFGREADGAGRSSRTASKWVGTLSKQMNNFRDFRPRLIPPFVALVPIIGALLGMINPLVAGLSAAGVAAFGMASNLASIGGVALAVVPSLVTLLTVVGALKTAFNGVGGAFQKFNAMRQAAIKAGVKGGGSGGKEELSYAEQVERAEVRVARAQEDVRFAQEDLTKAREEYYDTIKKLTDQLNDLSEAEDKAQASAQLAAEWAQQVANDPNADETDKQAAADFAAQKAKEAEDATKARQEGEKELKDAKGTGVNNDRDVIMAQRRLIDAQWALRDAQLELVNTQKGLNGAMSAAAVAAGLYQAALDALSPSARRFVEFLVGMYDAWKKVQKSVQETFFSQFVGDLDDLKKLLGPISTLLNDAAEALGKLMGNLIEQVTSPDWLSDLESMSGTNVSIIDSLGKAFQFVLEILKDIAIVAAPLAKKLASGFADSMGELMTLVDNARNDGSLAAWLETVYKRLQTWWTIVKNIGKTLFNYGAASSEFGQWLTDGLAALSDTWVTSSENARKEGSAFQDYLDGIKEPLRAVGRLFKAFFDWWVKVSSDTDNLESFTRIMDSITTKLGPAVSRLLDLFAKSHTADNLIDALVQILDLLQKFLEKGGLEGFESFFTAMHAFFSVLTEFVDAMPEGVIKSLAVSLAIISALTFTGLGKVLQLFARILASPALGKVFAGMKGIGTTAAFIGPQASGKAQKKANRARNARAAGGGFVAGSIASIGFGVAGNLTSDGQGGSRDTAGAALSAAGTGAMIGAAVGSILPGVGTAIGLGVGAAMGGLIGAISENNAHWRAQEAKQEKEANAQGKTYYRNPSDNYLQGTLMTQQQADARYQTDAAMGGAAPTYDRGGTGGTNSTGDYAVYEKQNQAYNNMYNSLVYANGQIDRYNTLQETSERNTRLTTEATITATEYQRAYSDALAYTNQLYTNQQTLEAAKTLVDQAQKEATDALTQAEKEKAETGKVSKDTQDRLLISAEDMATAYRNQADAVLAAGGTQEEANAILKKGETQLDKYADKAGLSATNVNKLKGAILDLPSQKTIDLKLQMTAKDRALMTGLFANFGLGTSATQEQLININIAKGGNKNTGGAIRRAVGGSIPNYMNAFDDWKGLVGGRGVNDSVATMLTPGEFVMRRTAVNKIGIDKLRLMNSGSFELPGPRRGVSSHGRRFNGEPEAGDRSQSIGRYPGHDAALSQAFNFANRGGSATPRLSTDSGFGPKGGLSVNPTITVNNPVAKTAEESLYELHREIAYKYGFN